MSDRPNDPMNPNRPRLDPEGRPVDATIVNTPVERSGGGMGSGWFIAGIIVVLLIIGAVFYSNSGPSGDTGASQQATTTDTAPTDTTTTGSTDQAAPAPAAPKPAAPSGDASGGADTGAAPAPAPAK